jgi:hypothetical protein
MVPAVLEAAPMPVHEVVPTKRTSYHCPETNDPALTVGLLAPPILMSWLMVTLNPLAYTVSPLPGRTPPFHVLVDDQLPFAIARAVAMA